MRQNNKIFNLFDRYSTFLLLLFVFSVIVVFALFPDNRLYYGPDSTFHYARINALVESLQDGRFPLYIDYTRLDGYGYGAKLFYSDFTLLPVALLTLVFGLSISYKIYLILIFFFSGFFTYWASLKVLKSKYIAILICLLVTFSYFKLYSMAYRGALGEVLSYLFIPVVVAGCYELIKGDCRRWYIFSVGFSLLLLSHLVTSLLTAIILAPVFLFYTKSFFKEKQRLKYLIIACLGVVILASYGLMPMFEQLISGDFFLKTQAGWASPAQSKLSLSLLLGGLYAGLPIQNGGVGVGVLFPILLLSRFFIGKTANNSFLKIGDGCMIVGLFFVLLISDIAPWGRFPLNLLTVIQFPWRLFEYVTFFWSISIAIYLSLIFNTKQARIYSFLLVSLFQIFLLVTFAYNYGKHNSQMNEVWAPGLGAVEYLPLKLQNGNPSYWDKLKQSQHVGMSSQKENISNYTQNKSRISFHIDTHDVEEILEIPLLHYKGYTATFQGEDIPLQESDYGLVEIAVRGKGEVVVDFTGTLIQRYSFYLTSLGFLLVLVCVYRLRNDKISVRKNFFG